MQFVMGNGTECGEMRWNVGLYKEILGVIEGINPDYTTYMALGSWLGQRLELTDWWFIGEDGWLDVPGMKKWVMKMRWLRCAKKVWCGRTWWCCVWNDLHAWMGEMTATWCKCVAGMMGNMRWVSGKMTVLMADGWLKRGKWAACVGKVSKVLVKSRVKSRWSVSVSGKCGE